jgi:hypothetical protein
MLSKDCVGRVKSIKGIRQQKILEATEEGSPRRRRQSSKKKAVLEEEGSPRRRRQSSKKKAVLEVGVVKLCLEERTIC